MQQLLEKLRGASSSERCEIAWQSIEELDENLQSISAQLDPINSSSQSLFKSVDIPCLDQSMNRLEEVMKAVEACLCKLNNSEINKIKKNLEKDYQDTLDLWKFFEILDSDGLSYTGDFGLSSGKKFTVPSFSEIFSSITIPQLKLYKDMQDRRMQPVLQITPIALSINTLCEKLNRKSSILKINTRKPELNRWHNDQDLTYSPTDYKALLVESKVKQVAGIGALKEVLRMSGGVSKDQWINDNQGILIDIVSLSQRADPKGKVLTAKGIVDENFQSIAKLVDYLQAEIQKGYKPMSFESYLLAQMRAIRIKQPLDDYNTSSFLLDNYRTFIQGNFLDLPSEGTEYSMLPKGLWENGGLLFSSENFSRKENANKVRMTIRINK